MTHPGSLIAEDFEGRLAALRAEFPGWDIGPSDLPSTPYRATREGAGEKALVLLGGTYDALWHLLSEQDAADCERALLALSKALEARGVKIAKQGASLVMKTRTGPARTCDALRGQIIWDSGNTLGPLTAIDEIAVKIARLLGVELHPQLSALARRMGVRGYKVDIGAPEITVATTDGETPRAVRVRCIPRPKDDDRDWFWTHWGDPIAEAEDVLGAEVKLVGLLAAAT